MKRLWDATGWRVVIALLVGAAAAAALILLPHLREDHRFLDSLRAAYAVRQAQARPPAPSAPPPAASSPAQETPPK